jgi:hypothetical protein
MCSFHPVESIVLEVSPVLNFLLSVSLYQSEHYGLTCAPLVVALLPVLVGLNLPFP